VEPGAGAILGVATACGKVWGLGEILASGLTGLSHPDFCDARNQELHCSSSDHYAPSPGGVGRSTGQTVGWRCRAAEPGISFQAHTVSFLYSFLPVPTPHLCQFPGILQPSQTDGVVLSEAALLRPTMTWCASQPPDPDPVPSQEHRHGYAIRKSLPGVG
jgi:hypothetical protein